MQKNEISEFLSFFYSYLKNKLFDFGNFFENIKDFVVALLVIRRGKYSSSFLNTSFILLVSAALIGGPIIAENNPFIFSIDSDFSKDELRAANITYNPYENSLSTIISAKPRDKMVSYKVQKGDTLESISKKFDVSINSIKWANNLGDDEVKEGAILKVPPVTGVVHKVASGDSVYSIAKKYKTEAQNIVNFPFNEFEDLDTFALKVGQIVYVPNGVIKEEYTGTYTKPVYKPVHAGVVGSSSFTWPTSGNITQYPTWYHMALDIADGGSPPVIASDRGTVIFSGCLRYGYGCHVIVDHGNGYQTLYAHLQSLSVNAGEVVSQGQTVGIMGSTGRSTGTHLHFEIRSGGVLLNPLNLLN